MQDRYLFRGKRIDRTQVRGQWVIGTLQETPAPAKAKNEPITYRTSILFINDREVKHALVDAFTIGQCTGLRDKNGTLIFEGDILELDNMYHPNQGYTSTIMISWENNSWCESYPNAIDRRNMSGVTADTFFKVFDYALNKYSRVIGNIHDNPELLEVQNALN